jgi:hypothetical protein
MSSQLFHLTKAQRDKLERGESIQVSHRQLHSPNDKERHAAEIDMSDEGLKKMGGAIRQSKGFRLNQQHYTGFGFLDDAKKFAKKNGGKAAEGVKKLVPQSTMQTVILNGLTAAGMSPESAAMISATGVSAIYATDFSKPVGDQSAKILSTTVNTGVKQYKKNKSAAAAAADATPLAAGGSIWKALQKDGGNQFKNGGAVGSGFSTSYTPMQAKMAALRAMRKQKVGGSFKGSGYVTPFAKDHNSEENRLKRALASKNAREQRMLGGSFKGGSFKGGAMFNFSPQSNSIVSSAKLQDTLAKYEGGKLFKFDPKSYYS